MFLLIALNAYLRAEVVCCLQGTCAFEAQNVIKLLTFDQVEKEKAAGQASTDLSARLADLIQDYKGANPDCCCHGSDRHS